MFELASRLVGVYKVNHMVRSQHSHLPIHIKTGTDDFLQTKSVTVENKDYITAR
jgi:hypothetical protein